MWNNNHSNPPPPVTPSSVAPGGDDFFDLGHQAEINNDVAKSLRDEISVLDSGLNKTSTNIKNEERSFNQLTKDHSHARGELFKHSRDAAEVLEEENTNDDLRLVLKDQFITGVVPHIVSPSSNHHDHGVVSEDEDGGSPEGASSVGRVAFSHRKFTESKRVEATAKKAAIHSIQQEIKSNRKKIKTVEEETASYVKEMDARQLDRQKTEGERNVEAKRREFEAESQRNRGVKEAVQVARANSGAYAQKIAEKAKEQMAERSSNVTKEATMTSLNVAKEKELALLEAEEKKLDEELAALSGQLDFLAKQSAEFEAEQKKSGDMKVEADAVQGDIVELTSSKEGKTKEAEASNADLQSALAALEDATKVVADINAEKLANDKATVEALEPAVARKAEAIKEKESLTSEVVELQKSIELAQSNDTDTATTSETKVIVKSNELKEHKSKLDKARADLDASQKDEATSTLSSELNEYKEFAAKFEAATKAEIDRLAVLKQERADARDEQIKKRSEENELLEKEQRSDVENLKQSYAVLTEKKELSVKIEVGEVGIIEDGEDEFDFEPNDDIDTMASEDGSLDDF